MKIVVFSDVHGREDRVNDLLSIHRNADAVLFLGDGIRDLPDSLRYAYPIFAGVRGNCDFLWGAASDFSFPNEQILKFESYTVMMTHGHLYGVKGDPSDLIRTASDLGANLVLYGHTHIAEERYLPEGTAIGRLKLPKPMWIMNPGSLGAPRNGEPSYGLIQIQRGQLLLSHGTL